MISVIQLQDIQSEHATSETVIRLERILPTWLVLNTEQLFEDMSLVRGLSECPDVRRLPHLRLRRCFRSDLTSGVDAERFCLVS